ncbi:N-acetyltransferase [Mumia zhuanghuii]|uniref:N-acetyltransferase n=2 Tax=Mumia TaxID=1546255 RepID=A0ABW1QIH7_9ACTN|nr:MULTISPECIES: N-acetyltransferase [Mumia]KAA1418329.1 N-acetyltransferase [Mumia zhuanghuii]
MTRNLEVVTLAARPDLAPLLDGFDGAWPEFMRWDPMGAVYYAVAEEAYPEYVLVALDPEVPDRAVACAFSVPVAWGDDPLPPGGWDRMIQRSAINRTLGTTPTIVSALEICVQPDQRGQGLSGRMLAEMRANTARLGFDTLVAPVRPSDKHAFPDVPMEEYAVRVRPDGLPEDSWLRTHVRAGGVIETVAPRSMVVPGTLDDWRRWTGLPFDTTGPVHVPGALAPVHCDVEQGHAVYVEANVWVRHRAG